MSLMRAGVAPLISLALVCCASYAEAQQTPARRLAARRRRLNGLNVLVVDVQSLLQNSKSAKMVRQQIEQKRSEYAKEISQQEEGSATRARCVAASAGIAVG